MCSSDVCVDTCPLSDQFPIVSYIKRVCVQPADGDGQQPASTRKLRWSPDTCKRMCENLLGDQEFLSVFRFFKHAFESNHAVDHSVLQFMYAMYVDRLYVCADSRPPARRSNSKSGQKGGGKLPFIAKSCWFDEECA